MIVASGNANKSKTIPNGDDRTKTFEQHREHEHERAEGRIARVTTNIREERAARKRGQAPRVPAHGTIFPLPLSEGEDERRERHR